MLKRFLILLAMFVAGLLFVTNSFAQAGDPGKVPKVHCKGITQKGEPCSNIPAKGKEYCRFHSPDAIRCGAPTKGGGTCKAIVKQQGQHCYRH